MKTLAERLAYAMQLKGFTQGGLSKSTGIAQPTIWRLVNGKAKGSTKINDIARTLGVNSDWLSNGIGSMSLESERVYPDIQQKNVMSKGEVTALSVLDSADTDTGDFLYVPNAIVSESSKAYVLNRNTGISEATHGSIIVVDESVPFGDGDLVYAESSSGLSVYRFVSGGSDGYLSVDDERVPLLPTSSVVRLLGVVVFLFKDLRRSR